MKPCETLFERSEGPAVACRQVLDGLAGFVEWTDVAALHGVPFSLLDPAEGKTLGPADIRALGVDPTCALWVEEGAGTFGMRNPRGEQLGVATANGLSLHVEDRQLIHATGATTAPALEARGMQNLKPARLAIHLGVQRHDDGILDRLFQRTTVHARSVHRRSCPSTSERHHPASPAAPSDQLELASTRDDDDQRVTTKLSTPKLRSVACRRAGAFRSKFNNL